MLVFFAFSATAAWSPHLFGSHRHRPVTHIVQLQTGPAPSRSDPHPLESLHVQPHSCVFAVARTLPEYAHRRRKELQREAEEAAKELGETQELEQSLQQPPTVTDTEPQFEIIVPEGAIPGDKLATTTPTGIQITLTVPPGAAPGTKLAFALPPDER